jgi:hypothetical protein
MSAAPNARTIGIWRSNTDWRSRGLSARGEPEAAPAAHPHMPAGIVGARTRRTVQVVSVDPTTHTVTFREPDGSIDSVTAINPANFAAVDGLRPGTNVVVTVTEAVAVSVEKV